MSVLTLWGLNRVFTFRSKTNGCLLLKSRTSRPLMDDHVFPPYSNVFIFTGSFHIYLMWKQFSLTEPHTASPATGPSPDLLFFQAERLKNHSNRYGSNIEKRFRLNTLRRRATDSIRWSYDGSRYFATRNLKADSKRFSSIQPKAKGRFEAELAFYSFRAHWFFGRSVRSKKF